MEGFLTAMNGQLDLGMGACYENGMQLDQNPVHRREIVPWYDSEVTGLAMILLMLFALMFSTVGIAVAFSDPGFTAYAWVPILSLALSSGVIASTAIRMMKRHARRLSG